MKFLRILTKFNLYAGFIFIIFTGIMLLLPERATLGIFIYGLVVLFEIILYAVWNHIMVKITSVYTHKFVFMCELQVLIYSFIIFILNPVLWTFYESVRK